MTDTDVDTQPATEAEREQPEGEQVGSPTDGAPGEEAERTATASPGTSLETAGATPEFAAAGTLPTEHEWSTLLSLSTTIAGSGMAPQVSQGRGQKRDMTAQEVAVIALKGRELGIPPMQALSHVHVVEGRPTASAELMRALVQRAGHFIAVAEQTAERATVSMRRKEWPESFPTIQAQFTIEEARAAELVGKQNWKKYPADMLVARATSRGCRQTFADVLMGASYTPDELDAEVAYDVDGEVLGVVVEQGNDQAASGPPAQSEPGGRPITDGQKRKLAVQMKELGIRHDGDGGDVLYRAGMMAAYGVESVSGLNTRQASALIEVLDKGRVDKSTGEKQSPADVAAAFLSRGSDWLARQEREEQDDVTGPPLEDVVDAEVVELAEGMWLGTDNRVVKLEAFKYGWRATDSSGETYRQPDHPGGLVVWDEAPATGQVRPEPTPWPDLPDEVGEGDDGE